jgi:hypothetical protein
MPATFFAGIAQSAVLPSALMAAIAESIAIQPNMLRQAIWEVNEKSADFPGWIAQKQRKTPAKGPARHGQGIILRWPRAKS